MQALGQAAVLLALPLACTWRVEQARARSLRKPAKSKAVLPLRLLVLVAAGDILWHRTEPGIVRWLALICSARFAASTFPGLPRLPAASFVPIVPALVVFSAVVLRSRQLSSSLGLALGRLDGGPLAWAGLCAVLSTAALAGWSLWWVRGKHGPIQEMLAPMLTPARVLPLAIVNALGEEMEFRMLLLGALLGPAALETWWLLLAVVLHALYFATLHVVGGFPSGRSGGALVFTWAVFLGILRYWAQGMGLVLLLHVQADVVIFMLVLMAERRLRK